METCAIFQGKNRQGFVLTVARDRRIRRGCHPFGSEGARRLIVLCFSNGLSFVAFSLISLFLRASLSSPCYFSTIDPRNERGNERTRKREREKLALSTPPQPFNFNYEKPERFFHLAKWRSGLATDIQFARIEHVARSDLCNTRSRLCKNMIAR